MAAWIKRTTPGPFGRSYYENPETGEVVFDDGSQQPIQKFNPNQNIPPNLQNLIQKSKYCEKCGSYIENGSICLQCDAKKYSYFHFFS
jgi:hypothetical protein